MHSVSTHSPVAKEQVTSSFELKLEVIFNPDSAWDLKKVREAGRLAAEEGLPPRSPLMELHASRLWYRPEGVMEAFLREYWIHSTDVRPADYFNIHVENADIVIESRGVARGHGVVRIHKSHRRDFFDAVRYGSVDSYGAWACDYYPVGGHTVLLRMDDYWVEADDEDGQAIQRVPPDQKGMIRIDPDTHPSYGELFLGDPDQEFKQLGALYQLQGQAIALLRETIPTVEQQAATEARAAQIRAKAGQSFMPWSGYCSCCDGDVTLALADIPPGEAITGCPLCGRSWCD